MNDTSTLSIPDAIAWLSANADAILTLIGAVTTFFTAFVAAARALVPALERAALTTATSVDDRAVSTLSNALDVFAMGLGAFAKRFERFSWIKAQVDGKPPPGSYRRPGGGTTLLTLALAASLGATASGCARGTPIETPLRRAAMSASVFHDAGVFASAELQAAVRAAVQNAHNACLANAETGADCDAEAQRAGDEWRIITAAHASYASAAEAYIEAVRVAAQAKERGEEPDLSDAIRLGADVLATYQALAELLGLAGVDIPPLPAQAVRSIEGLR